jgi:hypothetical protein
MHGRPVAGLRSSKLRLVGSLDAAKGNSRTHGHRNEGRAAADHHRRGCPSQYAIRPAGNVPS